MHRYFALAIACLFLSVALSTLVAFTAAGAKRKVEVRTDAQTADIVAAVEALGRKDVTLKVVDDPGINAPITGVVLGSLGMAVLLWLSSGLVLLIETRLIERFSTK